MGSLSFKQYKGWLQFSSSLFRVNALSIIRSDKEKSTPIFNKTLRFASQVIFPKSFPKINIKEFVSVSLEKSPFHMEKHAAKSKMNPVIVRNIMPYEAKVRSNYIYSTNRYDYGKSQYKPKTNIKSEIGRAHV